jgi:large subunit ribosomal protein L16
MWIRINPNVPVTKKPLEMRMGQGKGPIERWIFRIRPQRIIFELSKSIPHSLAIKALRSAAFKLPVKTAIICIQE